MDVRGIVHSPTTKELNPMLTVIAILLVVLPLFALATLVYDTLKIADRIGGFPPVEFTNRAYAV